METQINKNTAYVSINITSYGIDFAVWRSHSEKYPIIVFQFQSIDKEEGLKRFKKHLVENKIEIDFNCVEISVKDYLEGY